MRLTIPNVLGKPGLISRLGGFLHDSRVVSEPILHGGTLTMGLWRYGYEYPAPEERRLFSLIRWRLYPWVPVDLTITGVSSLKVVEALESSTEVPNDVSTLSLEGHTLVLPCTYHDLQIALTPESSISLSDTAAPLAIGIQVYGYQGLQTEGILDLLSSTTL